MLDIIRDLSDFVVTRGEVHTLESTCMSNWAGLAQFVPDRERVFDPSRVKMVEVSCPISDRTPVAHVRILFLSNTERPGSACAILVQLDPSISHRSPLFSCGEPIHTASHHTKPVDLPANGNSNGCSVHHPACRAGRQEGMRFQFVHVRPCWIAQRAQGRAASISRRYTGCSEPLVLTRRMSFMDGCSAGHARDQERRAPGLNEHRT